MSNFDIEQCKKDGGLAIHKQYGEIKIIVFKEDPEGYLVGQKTKNEIYIFVTEKNLTNIPKKKKITIYVYLDDKNQIRSALEDNSLELNEYLNRKLKIIKTIKEGIEL
jgi:hypothetical protein